MSATFYPKKAHFETKSQIAPNSLIFNHELTEPAKIFLLALNGICSNTFNWTIVQTDIQKRLRWGQDRMENAIKSAVSAGYLKVVQTRNEKGLFNPNEFEFDLDGGYLKNDNNANSEKPPQNEYEPMGGFPPTDNPLTDNPYIPCSLDLTLLSKTTTTCLGSVVVFSCLEKVEIEEYEKTWLSKNYDEKTVQHAVEYSKVVPYKTSLIQQIKWACYVKPEIPLNKEESTQKNKELALKVQIDAIVPEGTLFEVLNKAIEICFGGNAAPFVLEYSEIGFKEKFKEALKKYRILPK